MRVLNNELQTTTVSLYPRPYQSLVNLYNTNYLLKHFHIASNFCSVLHFVCLTATNTGARRIFDSILRQCELCRIAVTSLVNRAATTAAKITSSTSTGDPDQIYHGIHCDIINNPGKCCVLIVNA